MSKKVNPNIFRLGIKNNWDSKYFEKKAQELAIISFNELQIEKFLKLFFNNYGLNLKSCKFYYKKNILHLFISYEILISKFKYLLLKNIKQQKIKILNLKLLNNIKLLNKFYIRDKNLINFKFKRLFKIKTKRNLSFYFLKYLIKTQKKFKIIYQNNLKLKNYFNKKLVLIITKKNKLLNKIYNQNKRLYFLKYYNLLKNIKVKNLTQNILINLFIKKLLIFLNHFLKNINIVLTLKQTNINNTIKFLKTNKKELSFNIINLKNFQHNSFFEPGINLIYNLLKNNNNIAFVISTYLSLELSKLKNPKFFNFFLKYIINSLKYFCINSNIIKGITISIKGNLGRKPRALTKNYIIGKKISKLKINSNLNFYESTCYTKKGTFGIKTWVEKSYAKWS